MATRNEKEHKEDDNNNKQQFEKDRFEFTLHDLVPKDAKAKFRPEAEYKRGIAHFLGL